MSSDRRGASTCDVIVVGAGFAGVTATRELVGAGLSTTLLEARDRIGGRTWTTEFDGDQVELGGAWVHWHQPHVWSELTRYGISVETDDWDFATALFGHPVQRYPAAEAFARLRNLFSRYTENMESKFPLPHAPLSNAAALADLDRLSMADRLDQMSLSPIDRDWLSGLLYEIAGSPLNEASLLSVVRWLALCDWNVDNWYDTNMYRPMGGTRAILDAMLADGRPTVRLRTPVASMQVNDDGVRVTTHSGEVLSARAAIVATPVNLWKTIDFSPSLPPGHIAATQAGMGKPHQAKVWIRVRGEFGPVFAQTPAHHPLNLFWTYKQFDDGQLIIGINADPELDVNDKDQVAAVIQGYLPEIDEVVGVRAHDWSTDPYSLGGNTCYRPGQLTRHRSELQQTWKRLTFAGADIASGWIGYIDGAIESGIRAARLCREAL